MANVRVTPIDKINRQFIPSEYLPPNRDEYYLRNEQLTKPAAWRKLSDKEIKTLVANANVCADWNQFLVADPFDPQLIKNCQFSGLVRIARLEPVMLEHHDLQTPAGITNATVIACDIGENAAIHDVRYLAHYIVGDNAVLLNIGEMLATDRAKFGNGIVKDGESDDKRIWLELVNEIGTRRVMAFDGMIAADAYIWAKYRDDGLLQQRLVEITQKQFDSRRGFYGTIGAGCVIKNSLVLRDVKIGPACCINGADRLENLTINSSEAEPTRIGQGVELVNGLIGFGCQVVYGCKAIRFVLGNNSNLKYGARLIDCYLGDNSTVSCCELLNNLIFPSHEQHHNNSFLIASLLLGQSNVAAGATIGSNHNSRGADGEIQAGRGFWPGLCASLKHNCRFASFTLLAKGDFPAELDIPLPFSLLNDDRANDRLLVIPAYWWRYNMYALARNTWKFAARDNRKSKAQHIEFDSLAPDTAEEMFAALRLLEVWAGKAKLRAEGKTVESINETDLATIGRSSLMYPVSGEPDLEIFGENMEASDRPVVILKARQAYAAYREMLHYYAVKNLLVYMQANAKATRQTMCRDLSAPREQSWVNLGGQLVPESDVQHLQDDIKSGKLADWRQIHERYDQMWQTYPRQKQTHSLAVLLDLLETKDLTPDLWNAALAEALRIQKYVFEQVYMTRRKDYDNPFRKITFRNADEMKAVLGTPETNSFVQQVRQETETFKQTVMSIKARG